MGRWWVTLELGTGAGRVSLGRPKAQQPKFCNRTGERVCTRRAKSGALSRSTCHSLGPASGAEPSSHHTRLHSPLPTTRL